MSEEMMNIEAVNEGFKIETDEAAEWAIEKILEAETERDRLIDLAKAKIETLKAYIESEKERCTNNTAFLNSKLLEYFDKVPHKVTDTQESYKLISGKLVKKNPRIKYDYDEEKLGKYLADNKMNAFIEPQIKIKWGEFKKGLATNGTDVVMADTGELVDGVTAVIAPATFEVKAVK